ncbi:predicted protein [Streptomyces sp. AA4]|nr:predicted protein [Streptomyces sp. AA4]
MPRAPAFSAQAADQAGGNPRKELVVKVVCSFSLLVRAGLWLAGVALVSGLALGHPGGPAPVAPPAPARTAQ